MSIKYVKCDSCDDPIEFGTEIYQRSGLCGIYCCAECFASMHADITELSEEVANNCMAEILEVIG